MAQIVEVVGWAGALSLLAAYWGVTRKRFTAESHIFNLLNLLGSIGIGLNATYNGAYPSLGLNLIWLAIAGTALARAKSWSG